VESVRRNGGEITFCEPTLAAREAAAARILAETGATLVHPYNDHAVIAGQGTAALELLEEIPDLDMILVPVGGGGLLSGTAIAAKGTRPSIRVIGAEPAEADDAFRSLQAGRLIPLDATTTIADGLRTSLGDKTFPILQRQVDQIATAGEESIIAAMRLTCEVMKLLIEPSCALPLAVLCERRVDAAGLRVGIILSGGNLDLDRLPWQAAPPG
jgi:threonine dehydratase